MSSPERFRAIVEHSPDLILVLSADGVIDYASPSVRKVLGSSANVLAGRLEDFVHPDDLEPAQRFVSSVAAQAGSQQRQVLRMQSADGRWLYIDSQASNRREDPDIAGILVIGRDVSERIAVEERLSYEALHDALTGLANGVLFRDRLATALSGRGGQAESVAVMLIDLDRFKNLNDTYGHEAGDELLKVMGKRLLSATRGSDTVARLGGDEFAVLLTGVRGREHVLPVLKRVETMLGTPVRIGETDVKPSGSIGIALSRQESDVTELLRHADVAMYAAKGNSRGESVCFFEPEMQAAVQQRAQLETDLRRAIEKGELTLAYQPLVELATGGAYGVEALVRWNHPVMGRIPPDRFIPLAEETGMIISLGRWVLHTACRVVGEWQKTRKRQQPVLLSVNLSARQLVDEHIVADVADALSASGLEPGTLVLELTESALLEDTTTVMQRLADLRALGVKLAIDDFGTGFSSLAYLRRFPVDILKIDRRFVGDLDLGGSSAALAKAVLGLGNTLSLRTVAEGIETESQLLELRAMGCHYGQGYLFAVPLEPADAELYVNRG